MSYTYTLIKWQAFIFSPQAWIVLAFGLVIGSFLNVCIYRIPKKEFWSQLRSYCPHCQSLIPAWYNIPIFSFIWLRGKSACCRKPISWRYPVVELVTAALMVIIFYQHTFFVWQDFQFKFNVNETLRFIHAAVFSALLIVVSFIDLELKIIPNVISLPMMGAAPLVAYFHPDLQVYDSVLGLLVGTGAVYLVAWIYYMIRKAEGIGMGDAKLLGAIGGWLGYQAVLPTFFYASVIGSVCGLLVMLASRSTNLRSEVPFGPFLALASLIYYLIDREWTLQWLLVVR